MGVSGSPNPLRASLAVEDRLFRALAVVRVVTLVNAIAVNIYGFDTFTRPTVGVAALGVMVVWTVVVTYLYRVPHRRSLPLLIIDLAVALTLLAISPLAKGADFEAMIPGFWVMSALFAWAIRFHWQGGLLAAVLLGAVDLVTRAEITQTNYGNVFLLMIGGPVVGFMAASLKEMAAERDVAQTAAATATERARLARAVHDGVLQVLALTQRRGAEMGGDAAELGRLAGEQEAALRTLIRSQDAFAPTLRGTADLAAAVARLPVHRAVTISTPATTVETDAHRVQEVVAVISACLDNVARHVGEQAPVWVLLEAWEDRVEISVRDEGPGIAEGRLDEAAEEGRLGVTQSIQGRIEDLGGSARLHTDATGTEWEFVVPLSSVGDLP